MNKFYITTAIPYVNAKPHIGHALEFVQADVIARYHKLLDEKVCLLSGADENALKNVQAAEEAKITVQELVDKNAKLFEDLAKKLSVEFDVFQRGSSKSHHESSQRLWKLCKDDIYKKKYTGLYCVGCEQFYTKEELDEKGECLEHPGKKLEEVSEENYFFRLSKYQKDLKELIENDTINIVPQNRKNEIISFLKEGLDDISISRSNKRAKKWGVPVPGDPEQIMYVWFDALNIYQSGVGFGLDEKNYKKWWPADVHVIGKGILRFHAVYWPAFLLSAGLDLPKTIFVHDYITIEGQKMSKSLGNVIDPIDLIEKYGTDPLRYFLLAKVSPFQDGDYSDKKFIEAYNSDLANGLGNLVARTAKLCEKYNFEPKDKLLELRDSEFIELLRDFKFNESLNLIWNFIAKADKQINDTKLWELSEKKAEPILQEIVEIIRIISFSLKPFLPETSEKIWQQFKGPKIKSDRPLFPRL